MRGKGKRVRRSRAEWERIFEKLTASGLSQTAFCRREGISEGTLIRWRGQLRRQGDPTPSFIEWTPPSQSPARTELQPGEMELALPGGVRLRLRP